MEVLQRVSGMLFTLIGGFWVFGFLAGGGDAPRMGESDFAARYGGLISGLALLAGGLYMLFSKRHGKSS